ncbi:MAG: class E sortase [Candidatus Saccharibacteria bacterium]|nr:class E sortase [Candidatus Saccharibacteria bacterium]
MDSDTGGQFSNGFSRSTSDDSQRRAAVEIARKKVLAAYAASAENGPLASSGQGVYPRQAIYSNDQKSTYSVPAAQTSRLKDTPVSAETTADSWKTYHSAWQNYYQKYYSEYYSNAARNYIAKERLKDAREKAEDEEINSVLSRIGSGRNEQKSGLSLSRGSAFQSSANSGGIATGLTAASDQEAAESAGIRERLRRKIRKKATDSAKTSRRRRRFIPILAGLAVVLLILFLQYNRMIFTPIFAYISPGNAPATEIEALDPTITQTVSADPRLIIPKLNIDVPIRFNVALSDVMSAMNNGVAHYRISGASAYPGEIGNFIITGHSAGDVYSSNPYKYIFSGLERLEEGDLVYVNYNSTRYTYRITGKQVIEPTDVAALVVQTDRPLITLVTCTPLGSSRYRLLVTGEQISPSYNDSNYASGSDTVINIDEPAELPSNEPSFFEGIWNWLTGQ